MELLGASDVNTPALSSSLPLSDSNAVESTFATSWGDFGGGTGDSYSCLDSADGGDGHAVPEKYAACYVYAICCRPCDA